MRRELVKLQGAVNRGRMARQYLFISLQCFWNSIWSPVLSSVLPTGRLASPAGGHQDIQGTGASYKSLKELSFSQKKRKVRSDLSVMG